VETLSVEFNEKRREELLKLGKNSTYFFAQAILGMKDLEEKPHLSLCENLDSRGEWGKWNRGVICGFRGSLKSSIATIAFPLHEAIYRENYSCRIFGSSYKNARDNFFRPMLRIFLQERRNFLIWLYQHRIKGDFEGWTDEQISLITTDPLAQASITYRGMDAAKEGYHGDDLFFDDPEGADAEKSRVANQDSKSAIDEAPPLLINPNTGRILVTVTPWGASPIAYDLKDRKGWKVWWLPIVDGEGKTNWPARYPQEAVNNLRLTTVSKTWNSQYLLKKPTEGSSLFDWNAIQAGMAKWKVPGKIIEYPALEIDKKKIDQGETDTAIRVVTRKVDVTELRFYQHTDFIHRFDTVSTKATGTARPSKMAIVIVGVAPDFHAFVMGYLTERLDLDKQVDAVYRFYRTWAPFEVTFDAVGAQNWFLDIAKMKERSDFRYRAIESAGKYGIRRQLPALSARLREDKRTVRVAKEDVIHERLEPWLSGCALHIFADQDELITQLKGFPDAVKYVDLIDALAQGPPVWRPSLQSDRMESQIRAQKALGAKRDQFTGYANFWGQKALLPKSDKSG
jgi:hypothetical protein